MPVWDPKAFHVQQSIHQSFSRGSFQSADHFGDTFAQALPQDFTFTQAGALNGARSKLSVQAQSESATHHFSS
jgi:hypothetical protein